MACFVCEPFGRIAADSVTHAQNGFIKTHKKLALHMSISRRKLPLILLRMRRSTGRRKPSKSTWSLTIFWSWRATPGSTFCQSPGSNSLSTLTLLRNFFRTIHLISGPRSTYVVGTEKSILALLFTLLN